MTSIDLLVFGDEIESILTSVSAARAGARVALCRQSTGWLGGLSTRGGLAYMDITWDTLPPMFEEFLRACGVKRVCLEPNTADKVLRQWCQEAGIALLQVEHGPLHNADASHQSRFSVQDTSGDIWCAPLAVDATPDADIARALGEPFINGLNGLLGPDAPNHIGVSPVFRIRGVDRLALMAFEAQCRATPQLPDWLRQALPYHTEAEREALITRPCYSPDDLDYVDILNPVIGIAFHHWWQGDVSTYPTARVWIDGGNVARLPDGDLSFNGMVTHAPDLATLLHWSQHPVIPTFLSEAMRAFERFLQEAGGFKQAKVIPPQQLYVRQTIHIRTRRMATATDLLQGGEPSATIGPYSYWLDTRGINLKQYVPGFTHFPKPIFKTHLDYALCQHNPYMAVIGRAAGYGPLAQGTCRIVQHNAWLAEALGPVAAQATLNKTTLQEAAFSALSYAVNASDKPHVFSVEEGPVAELLRRELNQL